MEIGKQLTDLRIRAGIRSTRKAAQLLEIQGVHLSHTAIWKIEKNLIKPRLDTLHCLCRLYNAPKTALPFYNRLQAEKRQKREKNDLAPGISELIKHEIRNEIMHSITKINENYGIPDHFRDKGAYQNYVEQVKRKMLLVIEKVTTGKRRAK